MKNADWMEANVRVMRLLALAVLVCATPAVAGLKEGYAALARKDAEVAHRPALIANASTHKSRS